MATGTDGPRAHDILLGYEPLSRHGACWYYVWQAYAAAGASTGMGSSATAYEGWQLSDGKHYDMNPPHGAAIWLGRRYDGNMDGDVFIAGPVDGQHSATDEPVYGQTGETAIRARMDLCGREYLGWTDHVLDCPITLATPPAPEPPIILEDDMILIESLPDRGRALIGPGYFRKLNNSEELQAAAQLASKTLTGNARQFDVWKAIALQGETADQNELDALLEPDDTGGADPEQ